MQERIQSKGILANILPANPFEIELRRQAIARLARSAGLDIELNEDIFTNTPVPTNLPPRNS